jgi:hypothetical protein
MKRIMLLLGLLLAIVVPALLVGQNKPNVTESNVVEPNISDPNYLISKKTELETRVIQLENRVAQLENQIKILFIDNLYTEEDIIATWKELREQLLAEGKYVRLSDAPPSMPRVQFSKNRPYCPFRHKEKMAWKEFIDRAEKMVEDPCDIKQKK